jgi:hypothetical protein
VWHANVGFQGVIRNEATNVGDWTLSTLASLDLPKGSFFLVAKTTVQDPDVSASTFWCCLKDPGGNNLDQSVGYSVQDEPVTLPLQGVVTLAKAGPVTLECGTTIGPARSGPRHMAQSFSAKLAAVSATLSSPDMPAAAQGREETWSWRRRTRSSAAHARWFSPSGTTRTSTSTR